MIYFQLFIFSLASDLVTRWPVTATLLAHVPPGSLVRLPVEEILRSRNLRTIRVLATPLLSLERAKARTGALDTR
eukprot:6859302-Prymnesium_polylepis.1